MGMRIIRACLLPLALLPASLPAQAPRVRDSAGIRIVENPSRLKTPVTHTLGATPLFDVGGVEDNPDQEFNHRQGYLRGARLTHGGMAVIDVMRLHFFNAKGKRLRIVGRDGSGPEEFRYLTSICRTRGDTLIVHDSHNRRVAVVDSTGRIVRTILQADLGTLPPDGCFDDGTFLLQRMPAPNRLTRMRTDGSIANVVAEFEGGSFDMVTQITPSFAAGGQRVYFGNMNKRQVEIYDPAGKLLTLVRSDDPPLPISDAEVEERLASTIPTNTSDAERKARLDRLRAMSYPDNWPPFRSIEVTPNGGFWVQDYQINYPGPVGWSAFDATGRLIGRLVLPAPPPGRRSTDVLGFGTHEVLVRRVDEDGGQHLTVYPLVRR